MYTAEQIRNKAYVPNTSSVDDFDLKVRIMLADYTGKKSIKIKIDPLDEKDWLYYLKSKGYNSQMISFLGTKYLEISW